MPRLIEQLSFKKIITTHTHTHNRGYPGCSIRRPGRIRPRSPWQSRHWGQSWRKVLTVCWSAGCPSSRSSRRPRRRSARSPWLRLPRSLCDRLGLTDKKRQIEMRSESFICHFNKSGVTKLGCTSKSVLSNSHLSFRKTCVST